MFQITHMTSYESLAYFHQIENNENLHNLATIWNF